MKENQRSMVKKIEQTSFIDYEMFHQKPPRRRCSLRQMQEVILWKELG
ncbi:MAG: hypothetical protein ACP5UA_08200 [Candidatus Hydrogenedens sp.]